LNNPFLALPALSTSQSLARSSSVIPAAEASSAPITRRRRKSLAGRETSSVPATHSQALAEENRCLVCFSAKAMVKLSPCGHTTYCLSCAHEVRKMIERPDVALQATMSKCPMCRADITAITTL